MDIVRSPPRAGLTGMESLSIDEIEIIHRNFTASLAAAHGVHAAATVLARSLEWLAQLSQQQNKRRRPTGSPPAPAHTPSANTHGDSERKQHLMSCLGWQQDRASGEWRKGPDPWQGAIWNLTPVRRGIRRRWVAGQWVQSSVTVQLDPGPFARGSMRECFRMRHLDDEGNWCTNWVAKSFLSSSHEGDEYEETVQMQLAAKQYCHAFNSFAPPKPVDILACFVVQLDEPRQVFCCEPLMLGRYVKYNSNCGFVDDSDTRCTPHAFSHFTWQHSCGTEMVVDVQGVADLYTDPQMHSIERQYGAGDLGLNGAALFFASHRCNGICHHLNLTEFARPAEVGSTSIALPDGSWVDGALGEQHAGSNVAAAPEGTQVDVINLPTSLAPAALMHAEVHVHLGMLHARAVHRDEDVLARGVPASASAGLFHLRTAATLRNSRAAIICAQLYWPGVRMRKASLRSLSQAQPTPMVRHIETAVRYLEIAAQLGVVGAMTSLAHRYLEGDGVLKSVSEAKCWLQEALDTTNRRVARVAVEVVGSESAMAAAEFEAEGLPQCMHELHEIQDLLFEINQLEILITKEPTS